MRVPHDSDSDEVLSTLLRQGNMTAFEILRSRYQTHLRRYVASIAALFGLSRDDQEDYLTECLLALLSTARYYTPDRGTSFYTYLMRGAAHVCRDLFKKRCEERQRIALNLEELTEEEQDRLWLRYGDAAPGPEEAMACGDILEEIENDSLRAALEGLSLKEREVLKRWMRGWQDREIADELKEPEAAVKKRRERALWKLQARLHSTANSSTGPSPK